MSKNKAKYNVIINSKTEYTTRPTSYFLNLHNPNLPLWIRTESLTYFTPYVEATISRTDNLPLEEEEIILMKSYLEKIFNKARIIFK